MLCSLSLASCPRSALYRVTPLVSWEVNPLSALLPFAVCRASFGCSRPAGRMMCPTLRLPWVASSSLGPSCVDLRLRSRVLSRGLQPPGLCASPLASVPATPFPVYRVTLSGGGSVPSVLSLPHAGPTDRCLQSRDCGARCLTTGCPARCPPGKRCVACLRRLPLAAMSRNPCALPTTLRTVAGGLVPVKRVLPSETIDTLVTLCSVQRSVLNE